MIRTLTCQRFFDGENLHGPSEIVFDEEKIVDVRQFAGESNNYLVTPGFIDLQVNGFRQFHVSYIKDHEMHDLNMALRSQGTTSWLATLITAPLDELDHHIAIVTESLASIDHGCEGIHLEGPFLGGANGAHNPKWMTPPDIDWIKRLPSSIRLMTIAPEHEETVLAVACLLEAGCRVSLGHTTAIQGEFMRAVDAGAHLVTHLFNGMSGVHHRDGGIALWSLLHPQVFTCVIPDLLHVSKDALSLAFRLKSSSKMILVSDSIGWAHPEVMGQGVTLVDGVARLSNGTIAGSSISVADGVRNCVVEAHIDLADALRAVTSTPAEAMGWHHVGRLRPGFRANINILNEDLRVVETIC